MSIKCLEPSMAPEGAQWMAVSIIFLVPEERHSLPLLTQCLIVSSRVLAYLQL